MFDIIPALILLLVICAGLSYAYQEKERSNANGSNESNDKFNSNDYALFRNNYLLVYLIMMMSDWLQGSYVYALYKDYGYDLDAIGILFVAGFLSSAVFGTVISSLADTYGRKRMCLVFVVLYTLSCFTKLSSNFQVLLLGRVLGGVSTSLLFSVFEAWMVSEHQSRAFPPHLLSDTFSWSTFGNGCVAIGSGVIANSLVALTESNVAPFMASALFLVAGGAVVYSKWTENYGENIQNALPDKMRAIESMKKGLQTVRNDPTIFSVGSIVALFESSMYTFVFLWGPVLESAESSDTKLPFGLIFASFMVSIMIGSVLFRIALSNKMAVEQLMPYILCVASLSFMIPIVSESQIVNFWAFNLFEICCGVYFPAIGTLRGRYVPEETRATIMNIFRLPLNLIVVGLLTRVSMWSSSVLFGICTGLLIGSFLCSLLLAKRAKSVPPPIAAQPLLEA